MMELENEEHKSLWLMAYVAVLARSNNNTTDVARFAADACVNDFKERFGVKKSGSS